MVIAIQRGLEGLKEKLEQRGYRVYYEDEYTHPVDAYIYNNHSNIMDTDYDFGSALTSSIEKRYNHNHRGVLLISAKNKNIEQIEQIINNRVYSPLF